mmetsp:Transcript_20649/g.39188  ORF Transcript_20649/g.39188 Transcript_20649/m.39188 type:complete len:333 (-) Transcript_20649:131-1129(-)
MTGMAMYAIRTALLAGFLCPASSLQLATPQKGCDKRYACQEFNTTLADAARLGACRQQLPVKPTLTSANPSQQPFYLFILADAFSGSSALHSLLMTSPRVTSLCPANVWMCEGREILVNKGGFMRPRAQWTSEQLNWTSVFEEYEKYWSMGPPGAHIRVEKSTFMNIVKLPQIMEHFANDKSRVGFILMTRSPCNRKVYNMKNHINQTEQESRLWLQHNALATLHLAGFSAMELKYENMVMDPCKFTKDVLDFLPELETLNPGVSGYPVDKYPGILGTYPETDRNTPLLDYALEKVRSGKWFGYNHPLSVDGFTHNMLKDMGYGALQLLPCE